MRIVMYNFIQPGEKGFAGGGVTVYLRNLVASLRKANHAVFTLSSGDRYGIFKRNPFIEFNPDTSEIIIYNSPNIAPARISFHHPDIYLDDHLLDDVPKKIQSFIGNVDVFHFHNIEGLTKNFFMALRAVFPESAIIYSAHNYNLICPQVYLWKKSREICAGFNRGVDCIGCTGEKDSRTRKLMLNMLKTPAKRLFQKYDKIFYALLWIDRIINGLGQRKYDTPVIQSQDFDTIPRAGNERQAVKYANFRDDNIFLVNNYFNKVIAVSHKTKDILVSCGVNHERITVSYIGTKHHEKFASSKKKFPVQDDFHFAYLGYMSQLKGFYFFLEAIENLPEEILARSEITVAAKFIPSAMTRLTAMKSKVKKLHLYNGYSQEDLPGILSSVNLGIVPPLWEDNLPQVAIEFVAHGIPILTSDKGGAQEISNNPEYVFPIDSTDELTRKICAISRGNLDLSKFWNTRLNIRSNAEHLAEILAIYEKALRWLQGNHPADVATIGEMG